MTQRTRPLSNHFASLLTSGIALALSLAGCVAGVDEFGEVQQATGCSDPVLCNTPYVTLDMGDFDIANIDIVNGQANSHDVTFTGAKSSTGGTSWTLSVADGEFVATNAFGSQTGSGLVGFILELEVEGIGGSLVDVSVEITSYAQEDAWLAGSGSVVKIAKYGMAQKPGTGNSLTAQQNICPNQSNSSTASVFLLMDETYDSDNITVNGNQTGWLTLACEGSALAKMALLNYGPQSDYDGLGNPATVDQRQATLKMLTADYCGVGEAFAEDGTPLHWKNRDDNVDSAWYLNVAIEALWNEDGATCLDSTRLDDEDVEDIRDKCEDDYNIILPACPSDPSTDPDWEWQTMPWQGASI